MQDRIHHDASDWCCQDNFAATVTIMEERKDADEKLPQVFIQKFAKVVESGGRVPAAFGT